MKTFRRGGKNDSCFVFAINTIYARTIGKINAIQFFPFVKVYYLHGIRFNSTINARGHWELRLKIYKLIGFDRIALQLLLRAASEKTPFHQRIRTKYASYATIAVNVTEKFYPVES